MKWYNFSKGFGFIVRDSGGKDLFLRASVLDRTGITRLHEAPARLRKGSGGAKRTGSRLNSTTLTAVPPTFSHQRVNLKTKAAAAAAILVTASVSTACGQRS